MAKAVDLTGQQFGELTVIEFAGSMPVGTAQKNQRFWYVECGACGTWKLLSSSDVKKMNSCGCTRSKGMNNPRFRHGAKLGGKASPEYKAWLDMKHDHPYLPELEDFQEFFKAIGWKPSPEHQLARHDNRRPHSKENTY